MLLLSQLEQSRLDFSAGVLKTLTIIQLIEFRFMHQLVAYGRNETQLLDQLWREFLLDAVQLFVKPFALRVKLRFQQTLEELRFLDDEFDIAHDL